MESVIARGVQLVAALGGAYLLALWFVLIVWAFRDIETRSRSVITQIFSTLLVVLFFIPGVLLYLILRPKETLDAAFQRSLEEEYLLQDLEELPLCRSCQRFVEEDFMLCPHCQTQLRDACHACARLVDLRWTVCPYCGSDQSRAAESLPLRVPEPAARWIAPGVLRRRALNEIPSATAAEAVRPALPERQPAALTAQTPEVASPAPIRLFDRRKTREAARLNGYRRPFVVAGNGTTLTAKSLVDRFGRSLDNGSVSQPGTEGNMNGLDHDSPSEVQPALTSTDKSVEQG